MTHTSDISTHGDLSLKMLNVGCGDTSHGAWINVDLRGTGDVECRDVTKGLPFPDASFDVVYHSHLLEHLPPEKALSFLKECHRVMKPAGVIRVLVPDLEQITKLYLEKLHVSNEAADEYDWMMLELFDQCVRLKSGGRMEEFLRRPETKHSAFVTKRMGGEGAAYWESRHRGRMLPVNLWRDLPRFLWKIRVTCAAWAVLVLAGGKGKSAFETGLFQVSGEVHQWMYDRFSLARLMTEAGFSDIQVGSPFESSIPDFSRYALDVVDGEVRKPDSLVMEGVKP